MTQSQEKQADEPAVAIDTLIVVAIAAAALSAAFLCDAVFVDAEEDVGQRVIALIAAGMAAGIALVSVWASGRAAERRNARRHQEAMLRQTSRLYESVLSKKPDANDTQTVLPELVSQSLDLVKRSPQTNAHYTRLVSESLELMKQLPQTDANHVQLVSQSLEQHPKAADANYVKLVSEWLEWNKQLGKEADANHTRLVSEWLELMKAIALPPDRSGPGK